MKRQYRITIDGVATTNFGYAYLALVNPSGSGRRLVLRSVEVSKIENFNAGASVPSQELRRWSASEALTGEDVSMYMSQADPTSSLPAGIVCRRHTEFDPESSDVIVRYLQNRAATSVNTLNRVLFGAPTTFSKFSAAWSVSKSADLEPITVNPDEAMALYNANPAFAALTTPRRIQVVVEDYTGARYAWTFSANTYPGMALVSLENRSANPVKLISLRTGDVGTTDTPTLRLVPIGQLYSKDTSDTTKRPGNYSIIPMDSEYGLPSNSELILYTDVGFVPSGVPEAAIADSSSAAPKGLNYLHTRDFVGPVYRTILAEVENTRFLVGIQSSLGIYYSHELSDLLVRRSGITVNQGEGVGLVNSAETASGYSTGAIAAIGAWPQMSIHVTVDIYPATDPRLSITGLLSNSDVVVLEAGTETVLASADAVSGTWNWDYDPDVVSNVDLCIYRIGSTPYVVRSLNLGLSGATLPVSQVFDRNYSNT